jgi:hypothetical protein
MCGSQPGRSLFTSLSCYQFLPSGRYRNDYLYPLDAVPIQPFRNPERMKAWDDFINVMVPIGM